jgi:hypothetical protein
MSGTVGSGNIRTDIWETTVENTPKGYDVEHVERATRLRRDDVAQPLELARTTEIKNLVAFYNLLRKILEVAAEYDGSAYPVRLTQEFPPVQSVLPCFTIKLIKRMPLKLKNIQEMSPRFRQAYEDPDYPGGKVEEHIMRQENIVEIVAWAKDLKVANEQAEWLEEKFWEYLWAIQWGGLAHPVRWLGREEDFYKDLGQEQGAHGAPARFSVITSRIIKKRTTTIRNIRTVIGILEEERSEAGTLG